MTNSLGNYQAEATPAKNNTRSRKAERVQLNTQIPQKIYELYIGEAERRGIPVDALIESVLREQYVDVLVLIPD
jgi:hypothetical protein